MSSLETSSTQNFKSLIDNYETTIREITGELDQVEAAQNSIGGTVKNLINENLQLTAELNRLLAAKVQESQSESKPNHITESDYILNLQDQVKSLVKEKDNAVELWHTSAQLVEELEDQLRIYEMSTDGLVPKAEVRKLKSAYEKKLRQLEETVAKTKTNLEQTINVTAKELMMRDSELSGTIQTQDNTFKIVRNLEDEVLKLQERLQAGDKLTQKLEKEVKAKRGEVEALTHINQECRRKVAESLDVVEAALREKDNALMRENRSKDEIITLSKALADVVAETDQKIQKEIAAAKKDLETALEDERSKLRKNENELKIKTIEVRQLMKQVTLQETELEVMKKDKRIADNDKLLNLEKNLEETFQKLLQAEKQNIQFKSDKESIKSDLQQMSQFYERDTLTKDAEIVVLKDEVKKLKIDLLDSRSKLSHCDDVIAGLNNKIQELEVNFQHQVLDAKSSFQRTCQERKGMEVIHQQIVDEMQEQLCLQVENNLKWRKETKVLTDQLELKIKDLKLELNQMKRDNKNLAEKLKNANSKMQEYKKFLESISSDVNKITLTLPPSDQINR